MVDTQKAIQPLVSVIITCYNQGKYLAAAIESVRTQSHSNIELIVIDDGSTDDTGAVCSHYPFLTYVYQSNSGLSAARNTGIINSNGQYLVFLDADDWLLPDALMVNLKYLTLYNDHAFVSGAFEFFYEHSDEHLAIQKPVLNNHYLHMLQGNYIQMHAAVMYQRWVFDKVSFDPAKRYCEDYDLYLRISKQFQIGHHTHVLAVYRQHLNNMSSNYSAMIHAAVEILMSQKKLLTTKAEKAAFHIGLKNWKGYYAEKLHTSLMDTLYIDSTQLKREDMDALKSHDQVLYNKFYLAKQAFFRKRMSRRIKLFVRQVISFGAKAVPRVGHVNLGDLNRTVPFSTEFGYDRGGPIDRFFIEKFLAGNAAHITGRALEIGDNDYTLRFGSTNVQKSEILHVDSSNPKATLIGDLSDAPQLKDNSFDCIILTQTLQLIYNYKDAIKTCFRILKPGGSVLITVPGISQIASDQWAEPWCWSFTALSVKTMLAEFFAEDQVHVDTYGNVLLATAFLYGMGISELKQADLDFNDPHYQLVISAIAIK
jgi:glycosyltransferase involved in cell wall biosynthesis